MRARASVRSSSSQTGVAAASSDNADVSLHVEQSGTGDECLVFVHGWPDDMNLWNNQVSHFSKRYRCVRVNLPHFGGREDAQSRGFRRSGYDFTEVAELLADVVRKEAEAGPVTLVIHDWGCVWGFLVQQKYPKLVKAIVAMDVGHPDAFAPGIANPLSVIGAGFAYQYWLLTAYLMRRATAGTWFEMIGQSIADWMARAFARFAKKNLDPQSDEDLKTDRITADACYPYYYFQTNFGVRPFSSLAGQPQQKALPSCPCLFLHGSRKAFSFHTAAWEQHLVKRDDCKVVAVPSGHWLQLECPALVNETMSSWLDQQLGESDSQAA